jgi:hypothetical protein
MDHAAACGSPSQSLLRRQVELCFRRTVAAITDIKITPAEIEAIKARPSLAGGGP